MLNTISGYWIRASVYGSDFYSQDFTTDLFPRGTNIYANISLSTYTFTLGRNLGENLPPYTTAVAKAHIYSWTFYNPDGTESQPQQLFNDGVYTNAVVIRNCAKITFRLLVMRADAVAQINIFTY
jgi:hypothetical protein